MKRLIASGAADTKAYVEKDADYVTRQYVKEYLNHRGYGNISSHDLKTIVDGILDWKRDNEVYYHHADMDTSNNSPENILLIDQDAHSYLHQISNELKWFRHYDMVVPGYGQGLIAKRNEREMYQCLYDDLGGASNYSVIQFLPRIYDFLTDGNDELYTSDDIYNCISDDYFYCIPKSRIEEIIQNSDVDFEQDPGVIYVDDETYEEIYPKLKSLRDANRKNSYAYHSYQAILDFMDNNTLSRSEIRPYYDKHKFKR